jgi:hypothetical protein
MVTSPPGGARFFPGRSARNTLRHGALIVTGVALVLAAVGMPVQAASARSAARPTRWRVVATIAQHNRAVFLLSVDAVSRSDAWADGIIVPASSRLPPVALIEQWNGRSWQRAAVPAKAAATVTAGDQYLDSIAASSASDVWAFSVNGAYLHRSGAGWQAGSIPRKVATSASIESANVFSPTDVWVFGTGNDTAKSLTKLTPFAARFNGHRWSAVRMPGRGSTGYVSTLSRDDMWAIAGQGLPARRTGAPRVAHWDGRSWRLATRQPQLPAGAQLYSILALSNRDIWVAGEAPNSLGTSPLAERWNGRVWQVVSPPARATSAELALGDLVPDGAGGMWATSTNLDGTNSSFWHYDSGGWTKVGARRDWWDAQLAAVPHSTSTWAVTGFLANRGLILLHGQVPR